MSSDQGFLEAIFAEPDDDGLRLIYADWLEERGDPLGTFIRTQVALAALPSDDPRRPELEARERDLLVRSEDYWVAPLRECRARDFVFRRGFVEQATLPDTAFLASAETVFRCTPLLRVSLY